MTYKIDVSQEVTDLKGEPLPLGGPSGNLSRIVGMVVTVPGDEEHKTITTVADLIETSMLLVPPGQDASLEDKRKAYRLAKRAERSEQWLELEITDGEYIQERAGKILPTVECGFLDELIETARAQAVIAEQEAEAARTAAAENTAENTEDDSPTT
jgi:hypothetical protein